MHLDVRGPLRGPLPQQVLALLERHHLKALVEAPDGREDLAERTGLRQHLACAVAHRLAPARPVHGRGDHDDVDARPGQGRDQLLALAELSEIEVDEHHPRATPQHGGDQGARRLSLLRHGHPPDVVALDGEGQLERLGEEDVVLDDRRCGTGYAMLRTTSSSAPSSEAGRRRSRRAGGRRRARCSRHARPPAGARWRGRGPDPWTPVLEPPARTGGRRSSTGTPGPLSEQITRAPPSAAVTESRMTPRPPCRAAFSSRMFTTSASSSGSPKARSSLANQRTSRPRARWLVTSGSTTSSRSTSLSSRARRPGRPCQHQPLQPVQLRLEHGLQPLAAPRRHCVTVAHHP